MNRFFAALFISSAAQWLVFSAGARAQDFEPVLGPSPLSFPRDHGSHANLGTEWWYFTGHLHSASGRSYGFELTFFRVGLSRKALSPSAWESKSVLLADFAITDDSGKRFLFSDEKARESFGAAGASAETLDVHVGNWSAKLHGDTLELSAADERKSLALSLRSAKPIILEGDHGFSQKGALPGEASLYTSFTRLEGAGSLQLDDRIEKIGQASAWMDHEAFTSRDTSGKGAEGWDWFALQLDSGEELMLYQLKDERCEVSPFSAGTFIAKDGTSVRLTRDDFAIEVLAQWQSAATGKRYPSKWKITIPKLSRSFHVVPTVPNQELMSAAGIPYWEGRSLVDGEDGAARGAAYVELVGY